VEQRARSGRTGALGSAGVTRPRWWATYSRYAEDVRPGPGLVHNAYFMPVGPAAPGVHAFETHNSPATFVYDDAWASVVRLQVVQETAAWAKFDGWSQASMAST
jgi:hypothetical protein